MFTGTDETRGLEEWNVNTIAHLEPEKAGSLSALLGGGGVSWLDLADSRRQTPRFFFFFFNFVLSYSNYNQQHQ